MPPTKKQFPSPLVGLCALASLALETTCRAQVAFIPIVGFVPTGSTLTVTPVVTPDRRYVRLGVDAFFNNLNGFTTLAVPAAVGGAFGGGFGGFGGFAGMNGVMAPPPGLAGTGLAGSVSSSGEPLAGPITPPSGFVAGDPLDRARPASGRPDADRGAEARFGPDLPGLGADGTDPGFSAEADSERPAARAVRKSLPNHRHAPRLKSTRRPGTNLGPKSP
jgi:hypothetical protein